MYPILFHVFGYPVHSWGVLLMLGFALAVWRAIKIGPPLYQIGPDAILDVSLFSLLGGIIGGRIAFVAQNLSYFSAHPLEMPAIWTGGMTSFGGFIGGVLAGAVVCRIRHVRITDMMDLAALSLPIGDGLGRIGCFLNGCCYGGECALPWAVPMRWDDGRVHMSHPAQIYAALLDVGIYFLLLRLEKRRGFPSQILLAFTFLYGVCRFFIEFNREGATAQLSSIIHLTTGQIASLVIAVLAAVTYVFLRNRHQYAVPAETTSLGLPIAR